MLEMSYAHKNSSTHIGCQIKGICSECQTTWVTVAPYKPVYKADTRWQIGTIDSFWQNMKTIENWFAIHVCDA